MPRRFLDTNILLRYFTRDDPEKAERALALLQQVEQGREKVATSPMVVIETVFTLQHSYRVARPRIKELVEDVISLRGIQLPQKVLYYQAFDIYASTNLSFADSFNAAYMEALKLSEIYSWDEDFDKLPGLTRVEPPEIQS